LLPDITRRTIILKVENCQFFDLKTLNPKPLKLMVINKIKYPSNIGRDPYFKLASLKEDATYLELFFLSLPSFISAMTNNLSSLIFILFFTYYYDDDDDDNNNNNNNNIYIYFCSY